MGDTVDSYNGGAILGLRGAGCVALASDRRLGMSLQTQSMGREQKIFRLGPYCYVALAGLQTDVLTVSRLLRFRANLYRQSEGRELRPRAATHMLAHLLYEHRFGPYFISPIVVGLEADGSAYLGTMDSIGAISDSTGFAADGTAGENLVGPAETWYRDGMGPEELGGVCEKIFQAGVNRDALSGWGGELLVLQLDPTAPEGVRETRRSLVTRMD